MQTQNDFDQIAKNTKNTTNFNPILVKIAELKGDVWNFQELLE